MADSRAGARPAEANGVYRTEDILEQQNEQTTREDSPVAGSSDSDNAERTARNKLKKTSLIPLSEQSQPHSNTDYPLSKSITADSLPSEPESAPRGRLKKKRSFEELQTDDTGTSSFENGNVEHAQPKSGTHKRMRSREISSEGHLQSGAKFDRGAAEPLQEESDDEAQESPGGPGILVDAPPLEATTTPAAEEVNEPSDHTSITSPRKKRSRDQLDPDDTPKPDDAGNSELPQKSPKDASGTSAPLVPTMSRNEIGEPEKKRYRDSPLASAGEAKLEAVQSSTTEIAATSGFANVSSASPFGHFASPSRDSEAAEQSESKPTSTSAFKSSGLSAFASSEKSPFGAFRGAETSGGFIGTAAPTAFGSIASTAPTSGFGNTGATSPFASNRNTGFGSMGSFTSTLSGTGFGGGTFGGRVKPLGGGLSSFASGSGTSGFGRAGAKQKAFGASNEAEGNGSDRGESDNEDADDRPKDKRFVEQDLETGEEDESTLFSCRAKLYHFEGKEWKERGVGTVKLNIKYIVGQSASSATDDDDERDEEAGMMGMEKKARLIMRTDGVHRVVLNTPIFKGMKVGSVEGGEPSGKQIYLTGLESGKGVLYILKIGKDEVVKELWRRIIDVQQDL